MPLEAICDMPGAKIVSNITYLPGSRDLACGLRRKTAGNHKVHIFEVMNLASTQSKEMPRAKSAQHHHHCKRKGKKGQIQML